MKQYDEKKGARGRPVPSLTSAFQRVTYTAPGEAVDLMVDGFGSKVPRQVRGSYSGTPMSEPVSPRSQPLKVVRNAPDITSVIAACKPPPQITDEMSYMVATPPEPYWLATSTLNQDRLIRCLIRLCLEMDWDWYSRKSALLNPKTPATLGHNKLWRTWACPLYGYVCEMQMPAGQAVWTTLIQTTGSEKGALAHLRRQVHNIMVFFANVEGDSTSGVVMEVASEKGRAKLEGFRKKLLSTGEVILL